MCPLRAVNVLSGYVLLTCRSAPDWSQTWKWMSGSHSQALTFLSGQNWLLAWAKCPQAMPQHRLVSSCAGHWLKWSGYSGICGLGTWGPRGPWRRLNWRKPKGVSGARVMLGWTGRGLDRGWGA